MAYLLDLVKAPYDNAPSLQTAGIVEDEERAVGGVSCGLKGAGESIAF